ncbi:MAG: shikimate dehydrogenase [Solirubrobacterales bacterium]
MPKLAVLGDPVSHSRSPAMHNGALAELGLADEWSYEAIEVRAEDFEARVRAMPAEGFAGANVTVPHKLAALALADNATETARAIGAANTLTFAGGRIEAENTDAAGLIGAIGEPVTGRRALVLGAGGSARACVWALREAGAEVDVWNRTPKKAEALAAELGASLAERHEHTQRLEADPYEILVNATTVGVAEANAEAAARRSGVDAEPADLKPLPLAADAIGATHVVVDLPYGPSPTPLARLARERGAKVVDGLEVLVHQGAASLAIWTGLDPPLETMRRAARES